MESIKTHRFYTVEKISEHIEETPEGYLLCLDVPITRTGEFLYHASELMGLDGKPLVEATSDGLVRIRRDEADVFSDISINSFNGKPVTIGHPEGFVDPENWNVLACGFLQNAHRGDGEASDLLLADILVTKAEEIGRAHV